MVSKINVKVVIIFVVTLMLCPPCIEGGPILCRVLCDCNNGGFISNLICNLLRCCRNTNEEPPECEDPTSCVSEYQPVCATNGNTFSNECELAIATCTSNQEIQLAYQGECCEGECCDGCIEDSVCSLSNPDGYLSEDVTVAAGSAAAFLLSKANPTDLCTLTKRTASGALIPVARSYLGQDWERVSGPYSTNPVTCGVGEKCIINLPPLESGEYYVITSARNERSQSEIVARFLEYASFGPTRESIDTFSDEAAWTYEQIYSTPMTLHREYYRERADDRWSRSSPVALVSDPCSPNSRWREAAFTMTDNKKFVDVTEILSGSLWGLYVDGFLRTTVDDTFYDTLSGGSYKICSDQADQWAGLLKLRYEGKCQEIPVPPPLVNISSAMSADLLPETQVVMLPKSADFVVLDNTAFGRELLLSSALSFDCSTLPSDPDIPVFGRTLDGQYFLHDSHLLLKKNTPDTPLNDGGGDTQFKTSGNTVCANVPRSYENEYTCFLSDEPNVCDEHTKYDLDTELILDHNSLGRLYSTTGSYIYAVDKLVFDSDYIDHPCSPGVTSRWMKVADGSCASPTSLQSSTMDELSGWIIQAGDKNNNPEIRDFEFPREGSMCDSSDMNTMEIVINADGGCWEHVHPDLFSVYNFDFWARDDTHFGNAVALENNRPHPIKKWADEGKTVLDFPSSHPTNSHSMGRWHTEKSKFELLGRYGDTIRLSSLPRSLRLNPDVVSEFGATQTRVSGGNSLSIVCGSPGEIANVPRRVAESFDVPENNSDLSDRIKRQTVWTTISVNSADQLRQRVAWALSQIFCIAPDDVGASDRLNEVMLHYYDIFVRNAFTNFRDILKAVSYSPLMGKMLSYEGSNSRQYVFESKGKDVFADENFAREVMQLFTIGLVKLNQDGTPALDGVGRKVSTYTNEDILSFARAWTGFNGADFRANIEESKGSNNLIDPMEIRADRRDHFPKNDLSGGFIGDKYPLCVDLPPKAFLLRGAKYRLLGSNPIPDLMNVDWADESQLGDHLILDSSSPLFEELCNAGAGVDCQFKSVVTLDNDVACFGEECDVQTLRVIQVSNVYFEYVRLPCVEFAYYDSPQTIRPKRTRDGAMCANSLLPVASEACCDLSNKFWIAYRNCRYAGERVSYDEMTSGCISKGMNSCNWTSLSSTDTFGENSPCSRPSHGYHWRASDCTLKVKIRSDDGYVAIVHALDAGIDTAVHVAEGSQEFFRVFWDSASISAYPSPNDNNCGPCEVMTDPGYCLCDVNVVEEAVFTSLPKDADAILESLFVGAFPNTMYPDDRFQSSFEKEMYTAHSTSAGCCDINTVFEVTDSSNGRVFVLKNVRSTVQILGSNLFSASSSSVEYSFRNPPHFISLIDHNYDIRDAEYETEAVLDTYFFHPNVAPFIARSMIQRFGFSNPSPGYIERVAHAFRTGEFMYMRSSFGEQKYGDMAALIAAIILDDEARSHVLDSDPAYGSLREPLVKVVAILRALEYEPFDETPFMQLYKMDEKIGQMAHQFPSVFSFYSPNFNPSGPVGEATHVSPESQIATTPKIIALLNGIFSLIKSGLSDCYGGFAPSKIGRCSKDGQEGSFKLAFGNLTLTPAFSSIDVLVEELSSLLTCGRMSSENKAVIKSAVSAEPDSAKAVRLAKQLVVSTPEFHATGIVKKTDTKRPSTVSTDEATIPYKGVVHLMLKGGCDSYNVLVPHSQCSGPDMYKAYSAVRGEVGLQKSDLLPIDVTGQVCSKFGIHPRLPVLRDLYDKEEALFVSNVGVMSKRPVTKDNYREETETNLFSHNSMQEEIKKLDPYLEARSTGAMGRMMDECSRAGYKTRGISFNADSTALVGRVDVSPASFSVDQSSFTKFNEWASVESMNEVIEELNAATSVESNFYAETFSSFLHLAIEQGEVLDEVLQTTDTTVQFPGTSIGKELELVARMIKTRREMRAERDFLYVEMRGFDTHSELLEKQDVLFSDLNDALSAFCEEMKEQGIWKDVTVIQTSDFARTLTPNSGDGTDHAWGGNQFILGGSIAGKRILGTYPTDLTPDGDLYVGQGRLIPTTAFDEVTSGIAEWMGVPPDRLASVLPNIDNFPNPFSARDLYG